MVRILNFLEIQADVITNEYEWCPVLHLFEHFTLSHALHGLLERFTCLLAFSKCIVEETHGLRGSIVINRP